MLGELRKAQGQVTSPARCQDMLRVIRSAFDRGDLPLAWAIEDPLPSAWRTSRDANAMAWICAHSDVRFQLLRLEEEYLPILRRGRCTGYRFERTYELRIEGRSFRVTDYDAGARSDVPDAIRRRIPRVPVTFAQLLASVRGEARQVQ